MPNKIDELNTRYLVPGIDLGTTALADADAAEEDYGDAPYSQVPPVADMPSPTGWQDLLGLNQVSPSSSQIERPPRPDPSEWNGTGDVVNAPLHFLRNANIDGGAAASISPKVKRMIGMLAAYDQTARRIRARASEGGQ